jgi:hypothetical protein
MKINYEDWAEANGWRLRINVDSFGRFCVDANAVAGATYDLIGDTPEQSKAGLAAWLEAAEGEIEFQRETRREYAQEKAQRAAKVVNTEAWYLAASRAYDPSQPPTYTVVKATVRGKKARSRSNTALVTIAGKNTSVPASDLKLGTAEDMEEYKLLSLARWRADKANEEARSPHRYNRFFGHGYGAPKEFKTKLDTAMATYNGDGYWTVSAEGIAPFIVPQENFRAIESMVEFRLAALERPYTLVSVDGSGYLTDRVKVALLVDYQGTRSPNYAFPDKETAQAVADVHNAARDAYEAVIAWEKAHRYTYGWEGEGS